MTMGKVAAELAVVVVVINIVVAVVELGMKEFERTYFINLIINNSKLEFRSYFVRWSLFWMLIFLQISYHITIGIYYYKSEYQKLKICCINR